jgi:hypothetical protein
LQITLTNTSTFSLYKNPDLLSGLFFAIATNPTVTTSTSSATSPTALLNPTACTTSTVTICSSPNVNLGNEWNYVYSSTGFSSTYLTTTASYGIASSQYSSLTPSFGISAVLGTGDPALSGKGTPQLAFSIVGSAYNASTSSISNKDPLVQNSVTFDLALPSGVTSLKISNVSFAYGTAPDGSSAGLLVPEPSSLALFSLGSAIVGMVRNRKNRAVRVTSRIVPTGPAL